MNFTTPNQFIPDSPNPQRARKLRIRGTIVALIGLALVTWTVVVFVSAVMYPSGNWGTQIEVLALSGLILVGPGLLIGGIVDLVSARKHSR